MPEPIVTYRPLTIDEIEVAKTMRAAMIRELDGFDPDDAYSGWRERYVEFYAPKMRDGRASLFVAELDRAPIGVAAVYLLENHRSGIFARRSAYMSNVFVEPAHRRRGIAASLTRMAVEWAASKGCEVVRLRSSRQARSVYASLGFAPSEEMELRLDL